MDGRSRVRGATRPMALLALAAAAVALLTACGDNPSSDPTGPRGDLTASPLPGEETPTPTESASSTASPTSTESPSPTESPSATGSPTEVSPTPTEPVGPTDADRARFAQDYQPEDATDLEHVAIDVDRDGVEEVVVAYVRASALVSHVDVAAWDGTQYAVVFAEDGGDAEEITQFRVADVNADGVTEVAVVQRVGASGGSLTLWASAGGGALVPLPADGGCHDGSHTYGVVGASIEDRDGDGREEIFATCDDSPVPVAAWTSDEYHWSDGAYRFFRKRPPGQ